MEARPPVLIDAAVRLLTPPQCREHVLGDLWERYASPGRYLADALTTLPFLLVSQARRNISQPVLAMQALILFASFGGLRLVEFTPSRFLAVVLPMLVTLAVLVLRDVYSAAPGKPIRRAVLDMLTAALCVGVLELVLHAVNPDLVFSLSLQRPARGGMVVGFPILFLLRMGQRRELKPHASQYDVDELWAITDQDLVREVEGFDRRVRQRNLIELAWGSVALAGFLGLFWFSVSPVHRLGLALCMAGTLFILGFAARHAAKTAPVRESFTSLLRFHREQLEQQRDSLRGLWWVYPLPLLPGGAVLVLGLALSGDSAGFAPALSACALAVVAAILTGITNHRVAMRLQEKLERLLMADEVLTARPRKRAARK
jgi:hypothetical protein